MKFLNGNQTISEIKRLVGGGQTLKVAVTYWGRGATKELGLEKDNLSPNAHVKVICDLMSGACNPAEIRKLRKQIGSDQVKQLDKLHAKVWLIENGAIIGSSNASANGLGFEGDETNGLVEANLFVSDPTILKSIGKWFDDLNPRDITDGDLKRAEKLWKRNRVNRPKPESKNLYKSIAENPHEFFDRDIVIWAFKHHDPTKRSTKYADRVLKDKGYKDDSPWYSEVDDTAIPGAYIIDFDYDPTKNLFKYWQTVQVLEDKPFQKDDQDSILICKETKLFHVSTSEETAWRRALLRAIDATPSDQNSWEWKIEDFHKYMILPES